MQKVLATSEVVASLLKTRFACASLKEALSVVSKTKNGPVAVSKEIRSAERQTATLSLMRVEPSGRNGKYD